MKYDYLIVGSGLYGAIFAHEAKTHGKTVLVVDKRPLQSLIVLPIRPLLITKVNSTHCLSICIHSIKCGVS